MKQSRLFPTVLMSFMAILLLTQPCLSAANTFWNDFSAPESGFYNPAHHWEDNLVAPTLDLTEFYTFKILRMTDSVQLYSDMEPNHGQEHFPNALIDETSFAMPDELLTLGMSSRTSIPDGPSTWDSDMQPTSEPADDIVFNNDSESIKSMRTPAPTSLLLVALGLLSLCFTRRLRY